MFTEEVSKKVREMEGRWKEQMKAMGGGEIPQKGVTNASGIELKPTYGPLDIAHLDIDNIGFPGQYPFTRGNYPLHYQVEPLFMNQGYGMCTAQETRRRREWLGSLGSRWKGDQVTAIIAMDLPSQRGLDPDDPGAAGKVGECGVSISTVQDIADYFEGLPLEKVYTTLIAFNAILPVTALLAAYVIDVRNESLDKIFHVACNLHHHQWFWDSIAFPPRSALKISTEFIKWHIENTPNSFPGLMDGDNVGEAGAPPVMEVAFNLAHTVAAVEECRKVGLDPEEVAARFYAHPRVSLNFFEEIAKIRATRKLWAKIFKERFGCQSHQALSYKVFVAQTPGTELTAQEVYNNIIRLTIMAMAGMLADVEGLWIASYDEAIGIPTEEAVKVAVRTYQILQEETDIPHVTDPLGGSYYLEWLTDRMEKEIVKLLDRIEELGGYLKCWESGWLRSQVEGEAAKRFRRLQTGEKVKVGVNKYRMEQVSEVRTYRRPPEIEQKAIKRVRRYREKRDNSKVSVSLKQLREAAIRIDREWPGSCGVLMPALVEAARAGATLGEMHRILREVFGFGYLS